MSDSAASKTQPSMLEAVLERLTQVMEQLATAAAAPDLELRAFTPAEAGALLRKTENWVAENIRARRIPFTYIGKSPRLTAAHIRWIHQQGEMLPFPSDRATEK